MHLTHPNNPELSQMPDFLWRTTVLPTLHIFI